MSDTFVDACLQGNALLDEIDDWVEKWHKSRGKKRLHEVLGFTIHEYALWVERPESLWFIVHAHRVRAPVKEVIRTATMRTAARAEDPKTAEHLIEWLKKTGRLK